MTDPTSFDSQAESWTQSRQYPWVRMRYELTHERIRAAAPDRLTRILNIGSADGYESLLFDDPGIEHTLSDCSQGMLDKARQVASQMLPEAQIKYIHAGVHELGEHLDGTYDLILFHNVIEYIDRPEEALRSIRGWLAPGGLLSLRHLNRYSNMYQPAMHENDLATAARHAQQPTMTSSFGMEMHTYTGEEIADMLHAVGFAHVDRFGIMGLANFIPGNDIKSDPDFYRDLKALETSLAQQFPYYHTARFGLFLATRN
jgi:S-adenosylmethionine-dependent methyltransferase